MEIAFKVNQDSDFYKKYFEAKNEKQKFQDLAILFFEKHGLSAKKYLQTKRLCVQMTQEELNKFKTDVLNKTNTVGLQGFKINSELNKIWLQDVYNKINENVLKGVDFWWVGCFNNCGNYSLWDYNKEVYGMLLANDKVFLPENTTQIKMSEYYKIVEEYNNEH